MTSAASQVALCLTVERYESAEKLAQLFPMVPALGVEADKRHEQMFAVAVRCGFEPGGRHRHMTSLEWCRQRADTIRNALPNHLKEARK